MVPAKHFSNNFQDQSMTKTIQSTVPGYRHSWKLHEV